MSLPGNGIFVVRGEMSTLMTAMRRGSRWNSTTFVVSYWNFFPQVAGGGDEYFNENLLIIITG